MKKVINGKTLLIIVILVLIILFGGLSVIVVGNAKTKADVRKQLSLGDKFLEELDYKQAILAYEKAVEIDDKNAEAYKKLANAYKADGQMDKAVDILWKGYKNTGDESLKDLFEVYDEMEKKSREPTMSPTSVPTMQPTTKPTAKTTVKPTQSPTAKPTQPPTVKPTQEPWKKENESAHAAYAKMFQEKGFSTLKEFIGYGDLSVKKGKMYQEDRYEEDVECYFRLIDLNQDQIDELILVLPDQGYGNPYIIFTYQNNKIKAFDEILSDYPVHTSELRDYEPNFNYEPLFPKPKDGESLVFFQAKTQVLSFADYANGNVLGGEFQAYKMTKNSLDKIAYCCMNMINEPTTYNVGLNKEEVSKKEYYSYLKKNFSEKGTMVKFYPYNEFLEKCKH